MIYEVSSLSFSYREGQTVLNDISFGLREGEIVTILGRNGVGKSTLLGCLLGSLRPREGSILLCGAPLSAMNERQIARSVGFVPQTENTIFDFSVLDYVMMGCACELGLFERPGKKERAAADIALEELGIAPLRDRSFTELSGGEQQQVMIARAIVRKPRAILLDEPTSHLDVPNQIKVLRMIRSLTDHGYAVMFTTHNPDHALMLGGSAVLFDADGSIRSGAVSEVVTEENLQSVYGSDLRLIYSESVGRTVCLCPGL